MLVVQLRSAQPWLDPRVGRFSMVFSKAGWTPVLVYWQRGPAPQITLSHTVAMATLSTPRALRNPPFWSIPLFLTAFYLRSLPVIIRMHPTVCVAHQLDTLPLALILQKLVSGLRVVFDREDIYSLMVYPDVPSPIRPLIYSMEFALASRADLSIFPNEATREYAFGDDKSSFIIPNVPEEGFLRQKENEPRGYRKPSDKFTIAYFGAVAPHMGLETLINAVSLLAGSRMRIECVVAGDGPLLEDLRQLASRLGAKDRVHFLGRVERKDIPELLSTCDASAILYAPTSPIMWMATPNKLFESMTLGIPVIASNFGMLARIVDEAGCGLLANPLDANSVADAIRRLSGNPSLRIHLSENGIEAMRTKYSWEIVERILTERIGLLAAPTWTEGA